MVRPNLTNIVKSHREVPWNTPSRTGTTAYNDPGTCADAVANTTNYGCTPLLSLLLCLTACWLSCRGPDHDQLDLCLPESMRILISRGPLSQAAGVPRGKRTQSHVSI